MLINGRSWSLVRCVINVVIEQDTTRYYVCLQGSLNFTVFVLSSLMLELCTFEILASSWTNYIIHSLLVGFPTHDRLRPLWSLFESWIHSFIMQGFVRYCSPAHHSLLHLCIITVQCTLLGCNSPPGCLTAFYFSLSFLHRTRCRRNWNEMRNHASCMHHCSLLRISRPWFCVQDRHRHRKEEIKAAFRTGLLGL